MFSHSSTLPFATQTYQTEMEELREQHNGLTKNLAEACMRSLSIPIVIRTRSRLPTRSCNTTTSGLKRQTCPGRNNSSSLRHSAAAPAAVTGAKEYQALQAELARIVAQFDTQTEYVMCSASQTRPRDSGLPAADCTAG